MPEIQAERPIARVNPKRFGLMLLAIALGIACLVVLRPFASVLTWSAILAYVSWPLYRTIASAIRSISGRRRILHDACADVCRDIAGAVAFCTDRRRVGLGISIVGIAACREDSGSSRDHSSDPLAWRAAAAAIGSFLCRTGRPRQTGRYMGSLMDQPDHCAGGRCRPKSRQSVFGDVYGIFPISRWRLNSCSNAAGHDEGIRQSSRSLCQYGRFDDTRGVVWVSDDRLRPRLGRRYRIRDSRYPGIGTPWRNHRRIVLRSRCWDCSRLGQPRRLFAADKSYCERCHFDSMGISASASNRQRASSTPHQQRNACSLGRGDVRRNRRHCRLGAYRCVRGPGCARHWAGHLARMGGGGRFGARTRTLLICSKTRSRK